MFSTRSVSAGDNVTSLSTVDDKPENLVMKVAGDSFAKSTNDRYFDESSNLFTVTNTFSSQGTFSPFNPYWSYKFDGNGDYLTVANNSAFNFGTSPFTIESWVCISGDSAQNPDGNRAASIVSAVFDTTATTGWALQILGNSTTTGTAITFWVYNSGVVTTLFNYSVSLSKNSWYHIAVSRSGNDFYLFLNGSVVATTTSAVAVETGGHNIDIGSLQQGTAPKYYHYLNGYLSNLHIVKGTALYTSNFTPSTENLTAVANTSLLALQNPYLKDNSTNNFAITVAGDVAATSFSPFKVVKQENWSHLFNGTTDYLTVPFNNAFNMGTGSFTFECWIYPTSVTGIDGIYGTSGGPGSVPKFVVHLDNGTPSIHYNGLTDGSDLYTAATSAVRINEWTHIAFVRNSTTWTWYINGAASGTGSNSTAITFTNQTTYIGYGGETYFTPFNGYISNLRLVKGSAVYTAAFMPETTKTRLIGGTVFLSLQDKVLQDNGPYSLTVTKNGTPTASSTNPFSGSAEGVNWSWYFSGNNNYLSIPYSSTLNMDSGSFTFECWIYATNISGNKGIYATSGGAGTVPKFIVYLNAGVPSIHYNGLTNGADIYITASSAVSANEWTHIAFVRNSTTWTWYINGVASGTGSNDTVITFTNQATYIGYGGETAAGPFSGYISNLRLVNGTAVYTTDFTPSTSNLTAVAGTSLLTLQNSTIVDNSTNAHSISTTGSVVPFNGNAFFSTVEKTTLPSHSVYFDGSGDYLSVASSAAFNLYPGNFTVECWVYLNSIANTPHIFQFSTSVNSRWTVYLGNNAGTFRLYSETAAGNGTNRIISSAKTIGRWYHLAIVKVGSTITMYIDGVSEGTTTSTVFPATNLAFYAGWQPHSGLAGDYLNGYISNLRIVRGVALYTADFVPPTTPLDVTSVPSITSLLTCQSTEIADGSPNNFTVTAAGNAVAKRFSPFPMRETDIVVGSGHFVASNTNYLSVAGSSAFAITTNTTPFTVEAWVYPTASGGAIFSDQFTTGTNTVPITLSLSNGSGANNTTGLIPALGYYNGTSWVTAAVSTIAISLSQWNHVAAVFTGSTTKIFINGADVTAGSPTPAATWGVTGANGDNWYIGKRWDNNATEYFSGYISNLRFVKGTAVYTSAFTPPTQPVSRIANTSLLLNFASSGVFDTTGNSVLRKVGNAAASYLPTAGAYPKTGKNSIYLDGTGDYFSTVNSNTDFGTGDFTVECWYYPTTSSSSYVIMDWRPAETNGQYICLYRNTSNKIVFYVNTSDTIIGTTSTTSGAWYHIALSRVSGTTRLFVNGNLQGIYADTNNYTTPALRPLIGDSSFAAGTEMTGLLDDIKVHRGYGKYSRNFYVSRVATPKSAMVATGGTETTADGYKIHTFTSSGTLTVTSPGEFEYLLVGGGGSGGTAGSNVAGGGGGAGGYLPGTAVLTQNGTISVTVGAGGGAGSSNSAGGDSIIKNDELYIVARGGALGSSTNTGTGSGGSGGGVIGAGGSPGSGTAGPPIQGYAGASGTGTYTVTYCSGGGGGGAGGAGSTSGSNSVGGAGGPGRISRISGTAVTYARGGNGGGANAGAGAAGAANTGNGGGGSGGAGIPHVAGGSGIVIIRYKL